MILNLYGLIFRIHRATPDNVWEMRGWVVSVGSNAYDGFKTRRAAVAYANSFFN